MSLEPIPATLIEERIFFIRGQRVMLDSHLAELYEVSTGNLNKAVARNRDSFPEDFMFQLTQKEHESLRFQFGSLKRGEHSKYLPRAFTEHGVAMLSSVLKSKRAVRVNIDIIRTFVRLRRLVASQAGLARRLFELEARCDSQFKEVFAALRELIAPPTSPRPKIGFRGTRG
jgi:hypothetical protein